MHCFVHTFRILLPVPRQDNVNDLGYFCLSIKAQNRQHLNTIDKNVGYTIRHFCLIDTVHSGADSLGTLQNMVTDLPYLFRHTKSALEGVIGMAAEVSFLLVVQFFLFEVNHLFPPINLSAAMAA